MEILAGTVVLAPFFCWIRLRGVDSGSTAATHSAEVEGSGLSMGIGRFLAWCRCRKAVVAGLLLMLGLASLGGVALWTTAQLAANYGAESRLEGPVSGQLPALPPEPMYGGPELSLHLLGSKTEAEVPFLCCGRVAMPTSLSLHPGFSSLIERPPK